jgi:hypothetical protein
MRAISTTHGFKLAIGLAVVASLFAGAAAAPAQTAREASQSITKAGVGGVKLGERYTVLRAQGLIGKIGPGCELGGPNTRSAKLRSPLKGSVDFTLTSPRRVMTISVTGGAKAHGVGIGSTITQIKNVFTHAKVDHSTEAVFGITLVKIPKRDGGRFQFAVSVATHKTTIIGIPNIAICD